MSTAEKNKNIIETTKLVNESVTNFNSVCNKLGDRLSTIFPNNKNIIIYNQVVSDVMKKNVKEPISLFMTRVCVDDEFRQSIRDSNVDFFLQPDNSKLIVKNSNIVDILRSCWKEMDKDSQQYVKSAMKVLLNNCETYIENLDKLNKLNNK